MIGAIVAILYIVISIKNLNNSVEERNKSYNQAISILSLIKDKLDIKEKEIAQKEYEINKFNANYTAFQGTACMQCHLAEKDMFPYENRELSLDKYIKVVRNGIDGIMPAYINSPKKGTRDITDSELKRQFKLLKDLEKQKIHLTLKR